MFSSLRFRLTVYYSAALMLILGFVALATYAILKQETRKKTDADLTELSDSFLATVRAELHDESRTESITDAFNEAVIEHRFREYVFAIFDSKGELIRSSQDFVPNTRTNDVPVASLFQSPSFQRLLTNPGTTQPDFEYIRAYGRFRGYSRKFSGPAGDYTLAVVFSLHQSEEFLESIRYTFALIIPFGALLASGGGYFLARNALAPVVSMGRQASVIDAKNLHDRLAVLNPRDELGVLAVSFNGLLDRLATSIEQQRRFMADASHELRTPVAILRGEADVALSKPDRPNAEYRESLAVLRDTARALGQIVEDLFTLARADAGNFPIAKTRFYLDELLADCVRSTRALGAVKNMSVEVQSEADLVIDADEGLVRRLFLNLIDNAIKFTPAGGSIRIATRTEANRYVVIVEDSGAGIEEALQSRVFERFFRADAARTHSEAAASGAGLGLAISRWIAEAHGGSLQLTSSSANGSVFTVTLPCSPEGGIAIAPAPSKATGD
jgi:two-component system, OmpR family, sensor kinase